MPLIAANNSATSCQFVLNGREHIQILSIASWEYCQARAQLQFFAWLQWRHTLDLGNSQERQSLNGNEASRPTNARGWVTFLVPFPRILRFFGTLFH
jgi:hypothetical protein